MSTPDRSIDSKLLESACLEFSKHGFLKADLKTICTNAGITTGALYKRYKGKEDLFCAVVQDTVSFLEDFVKGHFNDDISKLSDQELISSWQMSEPVMVNMFKMLWDLREGFILLISKSSGTRYENFQHDFVAAMTDSTWIYYEEAKKRKIARDDISKKELHVLCSSFWTSIYEPFIHSMTWEEILEHCKVACRFFNWASSVGINDLCK